MVNPGKPRLSSKLSIRWLRVRFPTSSLDASSRRAMTYGYILFLGESCRPMRLWGQFWEKPRSRIAVALGPSDDGRMWNCLRELAIMTRASVWERLKNDLRASERHEMWHEDFADEPAVEERMPFGVPPEEMRAVLEEALQDDCCELCGLLFDPGELTETGMYEYYTMDLDPGTRVCLRVPGIASG